MIVLSSTHTINKTACHHIDNRIYYYLSKFGVDLNIIANLVRKMKKKCCSFGLQKCIVNLYTNICIKFDSKYSSNLVAKRGMLVLDQVLLNDVNLLYNLHEGHSFTKAIVKMGIRVLQVTKAKSAKIADS
uniref:Plant heme peroxidase family profile domain-containing protein n=1 Tax=Physcomitrium patens TaxID=3218 RepID=A0A2K1IU40_PHYPA|nr:hypothetical protein PHYPA_024739 [Physcomitrium patens]